MPSYLEDGTILPEARNFSVTTAIGKTVNTERTYRSYNPSSGLNISIGIGGYPGYYSGFGGYGYLDPYRFDGYGYDPYRYGSFEAPDLLKDPYFRERYRYDSKFPGRYRAPLMPLTTIPVEIDDRYGFQTTDKDYRAGSSALMNTERAFKTLRKATEQLAAGLAVSEYGEAWLEYLGPRELPLLICPREELRIASVDEPLRWCR